MLTSLIILSYASYSARPSEGTEKPQQIVVLVASHVSPSNAGKPAPEGDLKKLEGTWRTTEKGPFKGTITFALTRKDGKITETRFNSELGEGNFRLVTSRPFELKHDEKRRWLDLGKKFAEDAKEVGLADLIEYRFEGALLVLKLLPEDGADGEQTFTKIPKND